MIGNKIRINGEEWYSQGFFNDGLTFGYIFKDEDAFNNNTGDVCYIPEAFFEDAPMIEANGEDYYLVDGYTRKDLEELIEGETDYDGEPIDIEYFFQSLCWCCPDTRLNEMTY